MQVRIIVAMGLRTNVGTELARRRDIPGAVAEAAIVLIALFLAFVAGFAGWAVGHSTRHTRTVTAR